MTTNLEILKQEMQQAKENLDAFTNKYSAPLTKEEIKNFSFSVMLEHGLALGSRMNFTKPEESEEHEKLVKTFNEKLHNYNLELLKNKKS